MAQWREGPGWGWILWRAVTALLARLLVPTMLLSLVACSALPRSLRRDEAWARIQRDGALRVGMEASYPPFEWVEDGEVRGLDVDLSNALAERWGVTAQFVDIHFDGLYDALRADRIDIIISALPYDRTLTRDVRYSRSYFNAGQVLLVPRDSAEVRSLRELDGGRVAVELGSEAHQLVRQASRDAALELEILAEREPHEVLDRLTGGEADAIVCDRVMAYHYLRRAEALRMVDPPLTEEPYVIAMGAQAHILQEQVNAALAAWRETGFLAELEKRWF